ncbi:MAG: hypothetical protein IT454_15770 [Planctomycetes bacterium]|nr:hypothetical protein [Planctomycetota bacterium]
MPSSSRMHQGLGRATALALALGVGPTLARANPSDHFAAVGPEFLVNASTNYTQIWARPSFAVDGSFFAASFTSGQDPLVRLFSPLGVALTGNLVCTPFLNVYTQDEPECSVASDGATLVAWSERHGYDGEQMGIFGRIFLPNGTPLTNEIQINEIWQASQWRPLIARHPQGGWVVAWSGDWDGDALFRIVNSDGTFRTGDIRVNTFDNGAQVDTAPAVAPNGTMLLVFVDFSGASGVGSGTNLWMRRFDANGIPLAASAVPFNTPGQANGDQREPRIAADGLGRFIVVWEDALADGAGYGVFGRIIGNDGVPLTAEFPLHTDFNGSQRAPRVAADAAGNFIAAWEDWNGNGADIRAQRFLPDGTKLGSPFVVPTNTAGDQRSPGVSMSWTSGNVVVSWEGPGNGSDVYARVFETYDAPATFCTAKINSLGCSPSIGWSGVPSLSDPADFHVTVDDLLNQKSGLVFWGQTQAALSFHGGLLCVAPPVVRTAIASSGGSSVGDDCSGTFDVALSDAYLVSRGVAVGTTLYFQSWSRDNGFAYPQNVSLSNALSVDVTP